METLPTIGQTIEIKPITEMSPTIETKGLFTRETYIIFYIQNELCWSYRNSRGYIPNVSREKCRNPETVYEYIQKDDKILSAQEDNSPLSRKKYELLCYKFDIIPRNDDDIIQSYETRFDIFQWHIHGIDTTIEETLAYRRLKNLDEIKNEDKSEPILNEKYIGNELICLESILYEF